jgi:hypothetical protein
MKDAARPADASSGRRGRGRRGRRFRKSGASAPGSADERPLLRLRIEMRRLLHHGGGIGANEENEVLDAGFNGIPGLCCAGVGSAALRVRHAAWASEAAPGDTQPIRDATPCVMQSHISASSQSDQLCESKQATQGRNSLAESARSHFAPVHRKAADQKTGKRPRKAAFPISRIKNSDTYLAAPMRQIVVPQSGHLPLVIGLPFFVVLSTGSFMIFFALHFTQYASIAMSNLNSLIRRGPESP